MNKKSFVFVDIDENDRKICKTEHIKIPHIGQQINLHNDMKTIWTVMGMLNEPSGIIQVAVTRRKLETELAIEDIPMG